MAHINLLPWRETLRKQRQREFGFMVVGGIIIAGMLVGITITFAPILFGHIFPTLRAVLPPTSSALIGAPVVVLTMIIVSQLTPPPPEHLRRFLVEKVHSP